MSRVAGTALVRGVAVCGPPRHILSGMTRNLSGIVPGVTVMPSHEYRDALRVSGHGSGRGAGLRWTYKDLGSHGNALANGLTELGLKSGDSVAIMYRTGPEWLVLSVAAMQLGLLLIPTDAASLKSTMSNAAALIYDGSIAGAHDAVLSTMPSLASNSNLVTGRPFYCQEFPKLKTAICVSPSSTLGGIHSFSDCLVYARQTGDKAGHRSPSVSTDKAIFPGMTVSDAVKKATGLRSALGLDGDSLVFAASENLESLTLAMVAAASSTCTLVLPPRDVKNYLSVISRENCTAVIGDETALATVLACPKDGDLLRVQQVVVNSGGNASSSIAKTAGSVFASAKIATL